MTPSSYRIPHCSPAIKSQVGDAYWRELFVRTVWINVKGQLRGQGHVWWSLEVRSELESELKYDSDSSDAAPR